MARGEQALQKKKKNKDSKSLDPGDLETCRTDAVCT